MRCAILGGGTFAQNTYVPILEGDLWKFSKIAVDAVWSRSEETAKTLSLSMWHNKAEVHFGDAGLDAIIGSDSIEAVFIVLPPRPALEITLRCLRAGKHVLGEKPVGTNVEEIEAAIREHVGMGQWRPIWGIAENYRFEETYEVSLLLLAVVVAGRRHHPQLERLVRPQRQLAVLAHAVAPQHRGAPRGRRHRDRVPL